MKSRMPHTRLFAALCRDHAGTSCLLLPLCLLAVMVLASCRKDLCYDHDAHSYSVKVNVVADWELEWERTYDYAWPDLWPGHWPYAYDEFRPVPAEGIRSIVYTESGDRSEGNLPQQGGRLYMPEAPSTSSSATSPTWHRPPPPRAPSPGPACPPCTPTSAPSTSPTSSTAPSTRTTPPGPRWR